jgi:hypothetical protein
MRMRTTAISVDDVVRVVSEGWQIDEWAAEAIVAARDPASALEVFARLAARDAGFQRCRKGSKATFRADDPQSGRRGARRNWHPNIPQNVKPNGLPTRARIRTLS